MSKTGADWSGDAAPEKSAGATSQLLGLSGGDSEEKSVKVTAGDMVVPDSPVAEDAHAPMAGARSATATTAHRMGDRRFMRKPPASTGSRFPGRTPPERRCATRRYPCNADKSVRPPTRY